MRNKQWKLNSSIANIQREIKVNKSSPPQDPEMNYRKCALEMEISNEENCEELRYQVERLESQVHNLLGTLKYSSSGNIYNKAADNIINAHI